FRMIVMLNSAPPTQARDAGSGRPGSGGSVSRVPQAPTSEHIAPLCDRDERRVRRGRTEREFGHRFAVMTRDKPASERGFDGDLLDRIARLVDDLQLDAPAAARAGDAAGGGAAG